MIRKAVGAIVKWNDKFLLVHKVKVMDGLEGPEQIEGEWGFSKGGIKPEETDLQLALLRELKEETGSDKYKIIKQLDNFCFTFPSEFQKKLGFEKQETAMFLVEYTGDGSDIQPQDEEIDQTKFFTKEETIKKLQHDNEREYFKSISNLPQ